MISQIATRFGGVISDPESAPGPESEEQIACVQNLLPEGVRDALKKNPISNYFAKLVAVQPNIDFIQIEIQRRGPYGSEHRTWWTWDVHVEAFQKPSEDVKNSTDFNSVWLKDNSEDDNEMFKQLLDPVKMFFDEVNVKFEYEVYRVIWQRIPANDDWHFDNDDEDGRVLIVQLSDESAHAVFDTSIVHGREKCNEQTALHPSYPCGKLGGIGSAVYFGNTMCHRAPRVADHDFKNPRIILLARGDATDKTPKDEFAVAAAYRP